MQLKPLHNNVIIKPAPAEEITASGIVLPESKDKERPEKGEVVAIGNGKILDNGQTVPVSVKVGDMVVFKKYAPDEIKVDGADYLVVSDSDLIAIIA
jgi:chaperonin GroES